MSATMTTTDVGARRAVRTGLDEDTRKQVGEALQTTLVELISLELQGKQAHWNVVGPRFRSLHLQLDEMVAEYRIWIDDVAERMTAVGLLPDGRPQTISTADLEEMPAGTIRDDEVVTSFGELLTKIAARVRERVQLMDELDLGSQDVLIDVLRGIEEQLWMLQAQQA